MDKKQFLQNLSLQQKAQLVHGDGQWHTQAIGELPSLMMTDGPHGLRKQADKNKGINDSNKATCFPTACAVASGWNKTYAYQIGQSIAQQAIAENVGTVLGPGINIKRSPLCGRNFEYYSEDPLLAGHLAEAYVSGVQTQGVGCSLKHFAVNSQETRRMTIDAIVDERALREIYLSAFEHVVKNSQPATIMVAYNKLNGESCTQNKHLLKEILRDEWGYKGLVISDWGAAYDPPKALEAGLDLEMPSGGDYHQKLVEQAVQNGTLKQEHLDRACQNVVDFVEKYYKQPSNQTVDFHAEHQFCRQVASDCGVLLKNDGLLPLSQGAKLLVVGGLAETPRYQGAGSSHINTTCKSFVEVLADEGVEHTFARGYNVVGDKADAKLEQQAVELAKQADVVLFFGGLTDDFEGEGYDRTSLEIPSCQQQLLAKLHQANHNVVFVAFGGSPFVMPWLDKCKSLLHMYLGGEAVMEGAFDLLFGKVCPSGRLAETYPLKLEDTPCHKYFANDEYLDEHRESIFVGYRYYNTFNVPVQFPFGFGLSYTDFVYQDMFVEMRGDGRYVANVQVANVGKYDASHVVQVYVDNCDCGLIRPKRQLAGFEKVFVPSGQSVQVAVVLDEKLFQIYIPGEGFVAVDGTYSICCCSDVNTTQLSCKVFNVQGGRKILGNHRELLPCFFQDQTNGLDVPTEQFEALLGRKILPPTPQSRGSYTMKNTFGEMSKDVGLIRFVLKVFKFVAIRTSPSKTEQDPVAQMFYNGAKETPIISLMSVGGVDAKFVKFFLHHANKQHKKAFKALFGKYTTD